MPKRARFMADETATARWLGVRFAALHPLLQALHSNGGVLSGKIQIEFGGGLAGWLGRRLARRLGIPIDQSECDFAGEIRHEDDGLHWCRRFKNGGTMASLFCPIGTWPDGFWLESTGPLNLKLTVDVVDGGWYWRPLRLAFGGLDLPIFLFPRMEAYKRIEDGHYRFCVSFTLPIAGTLLRYSGLLALVRR